MVFGSKKEKAEALEDGHLLLQSCQSSTQADRFAEHCRSSFSSKSSRSPGYQANGSIFTGIQLCFKGSMLRLHPSSDVETGVSDHEMPDVLFLDRLDVKRYLLGLQVGDDVIQLEDVLDGRVGKGSGQDGGRGGHVWSAFPRHPVDSCYGTSKLLFSRGMGLRRFWM